MIVKVSMSHALQRKGVLHGKGQRPSEHAMGVG